jgi:hypothetical protein
MNKVLAKELLESITISGEPIIFTEEEKEAGRKYYEKCFGSSEYVIHNTVPDTDPNFRY